MIKPTRNSYHHSERTRQEAPPYKTTIRSLRPQPHPSRVSIQAPLPSFLSGEKWKQRWDEWGLGCHTTTKEKKTTKNAREDLTQKHLYKRVSVFRLNYRIHYHHPAIPSVPDRSLLSMNAMFPLFFSSPRISLLPHVCAFSPHFSFLNRRRVGTGEKKRAGALTKNGCRGATSTQKPRVV